MGNFIKNGKLSKRGKSTFANRTIRSCNCVECSEVKEELSRDYKVVAKASLAEYPETFHHTDKRQLVAGGEEEFIQFAKLSVAKQLRVLPSSVDVRFHDLVEEYVIYVDGTFFGYYHTLEELEQYF